MNSTKTELETILDNRPSVIRYSMLIWVLEILSSIISFILLLIGFGLLLSNIIGNEFLEKFVIQVIYGETQKEIDNFILLLIISNGLFLSLTSWVCKLVLTRNGYILDTLPYLDSLVKEEKVKAKKVEIVEDKAKTISGKVEQHNKDE
jgi:hypothetical protein